jgi:hypothetical protein
MEMTRNTWTTAVILAGVLITPAAASAASDNGIKSGIGSNSHENAVVVDRNAPTPPARMPQQPQIVSVTSSPATGRDEVMYSVPRNSQLLITNACKQHDSMKIVIGEDRDNISYGASGCTYYEPGFVVKSGEDIRCENDSGLERTCAIVGMLEELPRRTGPRARFIDLRR